MIDLSVWLRCITRAFQQSACIRKRRRFLGVEQLEERTVPTSGVTAAYSVMQNWGSGFQAQMQLVNPQASVPAWQLQFDYTSTITSIWDATIVSHTGSHYVLSGAGWDNTLPANGTVSFGFNAAPGAQAAAAPMNYLLNGAPLGGAQPQLPALSASDVAVTEPATGSTDALFPVTLSAASAVPVSVHFATADGTARAGVDYQGASGTLTFAPGQTQQTIDVKVHSGTQGGTFTVQLSGATGATLASTQAGGTIHNYVPPATASVVFQDVSDWGSGFNGQVTIANTNASPLSSWTLAFDFSGQISSIWNANLVSQTGTHFVVQNASWNGAIPAGGTTSFGFTATPGGGQAVPTHFVLNGGASGPAGGKSNPVASNALAVTGPGQPTTINVLADVTDPQGLAVSLASFTQPANGTVVKNSDGTLTYTPHAGFVGTDSFGYTISDAGGGTASATVSVTVVNPSTSAWPNHVFAPYVDMTLYPMYNLMTAVQNGVKDFTLAFIVADPSNQPSWGGYASYEVNGGAFDMQIRSQIAAVRNAGGDVMVSFGGASGQELAQTIPNVNTLTTAYQTVITAYGLTRVDFDIEGAAVADHASIDRRSQALAALQANAAASGKSLQVWFTLPVLPAGLTADGLYVVQSALRYGVHITGVNVMAMDYGESAAPNPQGQMGQYAIQAATSLHTQLQSLYGSALSSSQLWQMVGVTPMIGLNDDTNEVFDEQAAQQLAAFAAQNGLGRISMWSLNRDQQNAAGAIKYVEPTSSSLAQNPFDFSRIFETYVN